MEGGGGWVGLRFVGIEKVEKMAGKECGKVKFLCVKAIKIRRKS